jgi:glucans biosynthesis protein
VLRLFPHLFPGFVFSGILIGVSAAAFGGVSRLAVDHAYVDDLAAGLAAKRYEPPRYDMPKRFRDLTPEEFAQIRFRPDAALWRDEGLPFQIQFDHLGDRRREPKQLFEFTDTHVQRIPFARRFFDYGTLDPAFWATWHLEYAGFRVLYPFGDSNRFEEAAAFLDGTRLRAIARGQIFGASVRALVTKGGEEEADEPPPAFVRFWLGKPAAAADAFTVHALLDGPAVTGAYTFVIRPGEDTTMDVQASLHFRRKVAELGLAPISGMFWFGEGSATRFGDYRPEVHTVDGLLFAPEAARRVWRPLLNPAKPQRTTFETPALAGFGLLQRDRDYRSYEDPDTGFERRPGVWVETLGAWPAGRICLVEEPTAEEAHDNVMVYWMPAAPVAPDRPLELSWRLHWSNVPRFGGPAGWVGATRQTVQDGAPGRTKFVVDFDPASMAGVAAGSEVTVAAEAAAPGRLVGQHLARNDLDGSWRLTLRVAAAPGSEPVDLRARLYLSGRPVTETWAFRWMP